MEQIAQQIVGRKEGHDSENTETCDNRGTYSDINGDGRAMENSRSRCGPDQTMRLHTSVMLPMRNRLASGTYVATGTSDTDLSDRQRT